MKRFRYLLQEDELLLGSEAIRAIDAQDFFAPLELVGDASLASFRRAAGRLVDNYGVNEGARDRWGLPAVAVTLRVTHALADEFDEDYSVAEPVSVGVLGDGRSVVDVITGLHGSGLDEDDLGPFLEPLLRRNDAHFLAASVEGSGTQTYCSVLIEYGPRGASIHDAIRVGLDVDALLLQVRDRELNAESALTLIAAGRGDLLIGLEESTWLEAKARGYDLGIDAGRIELAQDVARFANGETAGLLVIGLKTKKVGGIDTILKMSPSLDRYDAGRYHRAIDGRLFPPILGLAVRNIEVALSANRKGHLLTILVPEQPEEMKPFLVHGAIVRGNVEGAFISIVQRRGEHSVPVSPETIHSTLAAGRALLRRGELAQPATRMTRKGRRLKPPRNHLA
jgi:hypothetical protein